MKTMKSNTLKSKQTSVILGVLTLVAIVAISPHAFAQQGPSSSGQGQQNGIPLGAAYTSGASPPSGSSAGASYGSASDPYGPLAMPAWAAGMVAIGIVTGVGVYSTARKH